MNFFTRIATLATVCSFALVVRATDSDVFKAKNALFVKAPAAEIITGQPEGTVKMYARSGGAYYAVMGNVRMTVFEGVEAKFVEGNDGCWYLYSPLSQADTQSYMKFEAQPDGSLVANLPQAAVTGQSDGKDVTLYINKMVYTQLGGEGDDAEATYKVVTTDNKIVYTLGEDGAWTMDGSDDGEVILGLSDENGNWYGYGEFNTRFEPFEYESVTPPAGLETEKWSMTYGGDGHNVNVGFDGVDVYFQGLFAYFPTSWVKGTLTDGKITVPSAQYIGIEPNEVHYCFFTGADIESVWNDYYEEYDDVFVPNEAAVFDYDADKNVMTLEGGIVVSTLNNKQVYQQLGIKNPTLLLVAGDISLVPADPVITTYEPWDDDYEMAALEFDFPKVNVDGILLNSSNLYYRIYADGEVFVFTPDEYYGLEEDMELVPYDFEDDEYDFSYFGESHTVFFYQDLTGLAVQTVYVDADGTEYCSNKVYAETAGIDSVIEDCTVISETLFDLTGRRVDNPSKGLYIRRTTYSDGRTLSTKTVVR